MSELLRILGSLRPVLRVRTLQGKPVAYGDRQLVPLGRSIVVGLGRPGGALAAGWARAWPLAVLVMRDGQTQRIPIPNPTRRAILAMAATLFLLSLAARWAARTNIEDI